MTVSGPRRLLAPAIAVLTALALIGAASPASAAPSYRQMQKRAQDAMNSVVPTVWRKALLKVNVSGVIGGHSSYSARNRGITIGTYHAQRPWVNLKSVMAHEFGHHIAFHYGSQRVYGAPPVGFPQKSSSQVETWADCVAVAMTGKRYRYSNVPPCGTAALAWTRAWLKKGPTNHPRTRV
ncbi:hypothetical protein SAMN05444365_102672 [Micromonospora pattaloongensis]|uniref:Uncharacterized protein n=1 Tax=Micromonospora pattaloongensis TaxID=405436 RepID=A0A1H3KXH3_9ACTN|nr:hypothetical protein [Micromonospora pattaloongensis]SDY56699.1 hypothetical protein SAMN05444365_102672 [Micromonospora pattaloongensis]